LVQLFDLALTQLAGEMLKDGWQLSRILQIIYCTQETSFPHQKLKISVLQ
jgi:hypothetical protein